MAFDPQSTVPITTGAPTTTNTSLATPSQTQGGQSQTGDATIPSQGYIPRCALHLVIRFDEYGATEPLRAAAPTKTTKNLNGTTANRSGLTAQVDPNAPAGVTRYVIGVAGPTLIGNGPQNRTRSDDDLTFDVMTIPKSVTWSQNGLRKAGTLKATLKFIDLPFDPRLARSVAVELLLGALDEDTAALEATGDWQGQDAPIIPRTYNGQYGEPRTNLRFQGNDYFGGVLNRTARVMAAGHGGQILVDGVTAGLLNGVDLMPLGPR